jgi:phage terminase large subunit-like protein
LTTLPLAAPRGVALPRISSVPPYSRSAGEDAIDLAAMAGLMLDDWQQHVLSAGLGERDDGGWSSFEVCLVVPRQNGKGVVLEAVELAGLFLFSESLILHSAHEFKTAAEAFTRVLATVENSDYLRRRVARVRTSHGEEGIELKNGSRLRFVARSTGSGRGFTGDRVILDEAYNLSAEAMAALLPTLSARPNPQLWYASSAGMPSSVQLARLRERGLARAPGLCYMEWSAPDRAEYDDVDAWAVANPALGIRITHEFVDHERQALPEAEFARERLGIWEDPRTAAVIDPDLWSSLADRRSNVMDPVAFAVDVSVDRKRASIAIAGRRADGLLHVEVIEARDGTAWIVERLVELQGRHTSLGVVVDAASAAAALLPALAENGVSTLVTNARDMANACGRFYDAVIGKRLRHLDSPLLNLSLNQARQRALGDAWAWQRRDTDTDITPIVAVTLALHGLVVITEEKPKRTGKVW